LGEIFCPSFPSYHSSASLANLLLLIPPDFFLRFHWTPIFLPFPQLGQFFPGSSPLLLFDLIFEDDLPANPPAHGKMPSQQVRNLSLPIIYSQSLDSIAIRYSPNLIYHFLFYPFPSFSALNFCHEFLKF
jgi:hypothetical protein